jgi:hypothetical protein
MTDISMAGGDLYEPTAEVAEAPPPPKSPPLPASAPPSTVVQFPVQKPTPVVNEFSLAQIGPVNEFSLDAIRQTEDTRGRASVLSAQGSSPDAAAKALALSKKTGVPADVVEADPLRAQERVAVNEFSLAAPGVKQWLSEEPINARLTSDDLASLGHLDKAIRKLKQAETPSESADFEATVLPQPGGFLYGPGDKPAADAPLFVSQFQTGFEQTAAGLVNLEKIATLRALQEIDDIEKGVKPAAGPKSVARMMSPDQRAQLKQQLEAKAIRLGAQIQQSKEYVGGLPVDPGVKEFKTAADEVQANDMIGVLRSVFDRITRDIVSSRALGDLQDKEGPRSAGPGGDQLGKLVATFLSNAPGLIQHGTVTNLPSVVATVGGLAVGGPVGAAVAGAAMDFPSRLEDVVADRVREALATNDVAINLDDPQEVTRFLRDNPQILTDAAASAGAGSLSIGLTEGLISKIIRPLNAGTGVARNVAVAGGNIAAGVGTEVAGETVARAVAGQEPSLNESLMEGIGAAGQTIATTVVKTIQEGGAARTVEQAKAQVEKAKEDIVAANELLGDLQKQKAETGALRLDDVVDKATGSKLSTRSPEKLQEFLATITGPDANVFVPVDVLQSYFQSKPVEDMRAMADALGITDQIPEALATGGDVVIPLSKYVTEATKSDIHKAWREDVRMEADGFSIRQAQEDAKVRDERLKLAVDRFEKQLEAGIAEVDATTRVYEDIRDKLKTAGKFTNEAAEQQAALFSERYAARAARNPGSYADAWDAYSKAGRGKGLDIRSQLMERVGAYPPDDLDVLLDSIRSGKVAPSTTDANAAERFAKDRAEMARELQASGIDIRQTNAQIRQAIKAEVEKRKAGTTYEQSMSADEQATIERELAVNDILHPDTKAQAPRSRGVEEIAKELMDRGAAALKKLGIKTGRIDAPEAKGDEIISSAIASEIKAALGRDGRNASDWYTHKIREAMAVASAIHPELANNEHSRFGFTAALAITSQGETVPSNVRLGEAAYEQFKKTGRFPTNIVAKAQAAMNTNFTKLNDLLDELGDDGTLRFLNSEFTVKELEAEGYDVGGENKQTKVMGSAILGPKIGGGFFQNLNGNYSPVTMDLWFMRAWGRLTGTLVGKLDIAKPRARFEAALEAQGLPIPKTRPALLKLAEGIVSKHEADFRKNRALYDEGKRAKSEITYAAERLVANVNGINETPTSGGQRVWMRERVNAARDMLARDGINVSNADLQAIWWYPEKDLYSKLGGRDSEGINVDYASALRDLAAKKGVDNEAVEAAVRAVDDGPRSASGADDAGAVQEGRAGDSAADERAGGGQADQGVDGTYEQEARGNISFTDNRTVISLFESRDLSTLIHESGHLFLAELEFDAKAPNATEQVKKDYQAVLDWLGSKDGYITRDMHEQFARGFETYAMEGKAPSSALASAFRSFKRWLVQIYKRLSALNSPITPELRQVFDRLIATDEQIEQAQTVQGLNPVFRDAKAADMTTAEFRAYTARANAVVDEAEQKLLQATMDTIRKQRTKEWKADEKLVRQDVTNEVMSESGQQALALLTKGEFPVGTTPEVLKGIKLTKEGIVDLYGDESVLAMLPAGIYRDRSAGPGAMSPDELAPMLGLDSGKDLIERLMQLEAQHKAMAAKGDKRSVARARIDEETAQRMSERYGDPLNDGTIEQEAMAAVHSDKQAALMATELRVLAKKAGHTGTITWDDIKNWAAQAIADKSVREGTQSQQFLRAERQAGRKVEQALIKGDFVAAFKAKQDQMVNHALYMEARQAAADVDSARKLMDRYASAATLKNMDQDYLEQIHALLEDYEFKTRSDKLLAERKSFEEWAAEQKAMGVEVVPPPRLAKGLGTTNYRDMTVDELRGLVDTVKQIAHLGRTKRKLELDGQKRELDAVLTEMEATAAKGVQRGASLSIRGKSDIEISVGAARHWLRVANAELMKIERLLEFADGRKDGQGIYSRMIFRPIADAQDKTNDRRVELGKQQKVIYEKVPWAQRKQWTQRIALPELGPGVKLDKEGIIAIALNMGNTQNLEKMLEGEKWTEAGVRAVVDKHLSRQEWQFVQDMWTLIDSQWPEFAAMTRDTQGVSPPKVEAVPLVTPYGTLTGGYYPIAYDRRENLKAAKVGEMQDSALLVGMATAPKYGRPTTKAGSAHARTGFSAPLDLSLSVIGKHLDEVTHDIFHRRAVMDIYKIISNDRFREALRSRLGPEYEAQFVPWLERVSTEARRNNSNLPGLDKAARAFRVNVTAMAMGLRVSTMVQQVSGYAVSMQRLGSKYMLKGMAEFVRHPFDVTRKVYASSGAMRHRANSLERDIKANVDKFRGKSTWKANLARFAFRGIALADLSVSVPTWLGAYHKGMAEGMNEGDAIHYADKMVRDTQGEGSTKDMAAFQDGTETWKLMSMFYSFLNVFYNAQQGLIEDARNPGKSFGQWADLFWQSSLLMVVSPIIAALLSGQGPDDEDDPLWWALRQVGFGAFSGIPVVRDVANTLSREIGGQPSGGFKLSPAQGPLEGSVRLIKDLTKAASGEDVGKNFIKNTFNVVGGFTGLPTGQPGVTAEFLYDALIEGSENPENILEWLRGMTYGPKK